MTQRQEIVTVLPEYVAEHLNAPFKVVLKNSVRQIIDDCGNVEKIVIPNPRGLLKQVAITRLLFPRKLSGADIKFVRKSLKIKAIELADMLGITPEHLSRCESGERVLSPGVEKCMRLSVILDNFKLPEEAEEACVSNEKIRLKIEEFQEAIRRLQEVIRGMPISSVYDHEEQLELHFYIRRDSSQQSSADDDEEDWTDRLPEAA